MKFGFCLLLATLVTLAACHERMSVIAPDAEIDFLCREAPSEPAVAAFLRSEKFSTVDDASARGKSYLPVQITGFDARKRMIELVGIREPPSFGNKVSYRLTIMSPPPTIHDVQLEQAALAFVRDRPGCHVLSFRTFDNGRDSKSLFDRLYAAGRHRIAEEHKCNASRQRLDLACPR